MATMTPTIITPTAPTPASAPATQASPPASAGAGVRGVVRRPAVPGPTPAQRVNRMTIDSIKKGGHAGALRLLVYGVEGVGKSTLGACAPSPVYLCPEDGLENLAHVPHFPEPREWQDVLDSVHTLIANDTGYQTFVIDTVDWIEPLVWKHICKQGNDKGIEQKSIEDFGYGKGYTKALDAWRVLLSLLERLRKTRGMNIVLLAHCHVKTWKNPEGDDFDRYMLKLNEKAAGVLKEWSACVLFANYDTFAAKGKNENRAKGVSTGERYLYTTHTAAYDAKNRFGLPEKLPLDWDALTAAIRAGAMSGPDALRAEIDELLARTTDGDVEKRAREALVGARDDAVRLTRIRDHLAKLIAQANITDANDDADASQGDNQ